MYNARSRSRAEEVPWRDVSRLSPPRPRSPSAADAIAAQAPAPADKPRRHANAPANARRPVDPNLAQGQGRGGAPIQAARAAIKGTGGITGTATLYEIANSGNGHMVQVVLTLQGAPPGIHGVHIHGTGRCEGPDFKSAGGHFDPGPAGNPDPEVNHPYHMGDLPNINGERAGHRSVQRLHDARHDGGTNRTIRQLTVRRS